MKVNNKIKKNLSYKKDGTEVIIAAYGDDSADFWQKIML